jgi:hypothetical protein
MSDYENERNKAVRPIFDCTPPEANIDAVLRACADWGRDYVLNSPELKNVLEVLENCRDEGFGANEVLDKFEQAFKAGAQK